MAPSQERAGHPPRLTTLTYWLPFGLLGCLGLLHALVTFTGWGSPDGRSCFYDSFYVPFALCGAWAVGTAASRHQGRQRRAWGFIATGLVMYAAGSAAWTYIEKYLGGNPYPSVADLFYLMVVPLFLVGFSYLSPAPLKPSAMRALGLDVAIIVTSAAVYSWAFFLAPTLLAYDGDPLTLAVSLAYPMSDLVLLSMLLLVVLRREDSVGRSHALFAAALLCWITFDVLFAVLATSGSYVAGHPIDTIWTPAAFLIALAAHTSLGPKRVRPALWLQSLWRLTPYLPPVAVVATYILLLERVITPRGTDDSTFLLGLTSGAALVTTLVIVRQLLALHENRRLNRTLDTTNADLRSLSHDLELRVRERTSELEALSNRYRHDALHDALTGLPNRAHFQKRLQDAVRQAQPFAVLYLDFDHFKAVNDSFGHAVGDALLVAIGSRLGACIRPNDLVARLGGDEFAVLFEGSNVADAVRGAERLTQVFQSPIHIRTHRLHCTPSIGVVMGDDARTSAENVLRDADIAMYRAKTSGRSQYVVFEAAMRENIQARLALETDLRGAVEQEQLVVHYQPVLHGASGKLAGFEALVRWLHPERGMVSPGEFIPLAEETGLIIDIDRWVLRTACAQLKAWSHDNPELTLSVNLSSRQFNCPTLAPFIAGVLAEFDLEAHRLKLELTESLLTDLSLRVRETLTALRQLGLRLHIDDFGTGYSSLSYLQRFDADVLKVDRSFVMKMLENDDSAELVRTIVSMAHNLGMQVVAEGVETAEQYALLRALGCEYVQGYLFSKPVPADAASLLASNKNSTAA